MNTKMLDLKYDKDNEILTRVLQNLMNSETPVSINGLPDVIRKELENSDIEKDAFVHPVVDTEGGVVKLFCGDEDEVIKAAERYYSSRPAEAADESAPGDLEVPATPEDQPKSLEEAIALEKKNAEDAARKNPQGDENRMGGGMLSALFALAKYAGKGGGMVGAKYKKGRTDKFNATAAMADHHGERLEECMDSLHADLADVGYNDVTDPAEKRRRLDNVLSTEKGRMLKESIAAHQREYLNHSNKLVAAMKSSRADGQIKKDTHPRAERILKKSKNLPEGMIDKDAIRTMAENLMASIKRVMAKLKPGGGNKDGAVAAPGVSP